MWLMQDVPIRWNLTYLMLESTIYYKRVLCSFACIDRNFQHRPTSSQWEKAQIVTIFLKAFYDLTCIFLGLKYPTSNLFFPNLLGVIHYWNNTWEVRIWSWKIWLKKYIQNLKSKIEAITFCYDMVFEKHSFQLENFRKKKHFF